MKKFLISRYYKNNMENSINTSLDKLKYDLRKYPVRPHIGVGVMFVRDNQLLLVERKYNPDAGYWSIPGGHLDLGERVEHAAIREAEEETGFKTKVTKLAGIINKIMYRSHRCHITDHQIGFCLRSFHRYLTNRRVALFFAAAD